MKSGRYVVAYGGGPPSVTISAGTNVACRRDDRVPITMSSSAGAITGRVTLTNRRPASGSAQRGDLVELLGHLSSGDQRDEEALAELEHPHEHDGPSGRCRLRNQAGVGRPAAPKSEVQRARTSGFRIQIQSSAYAASGITVGTSTETRPAAWSSAAVDGGAGRSRARPRAGAAPRRSRTGATVPQGDPEDGIVDQLPEGWPSRRTAVTAPGPIRRTPSRATRTPATG